MVASANTFERLFGGGSNEFNVKAAAKNDQSQEAGFAWGLDKGLCAEPTMQCLDKMLGTRKQRVKAPGDPEYMPAVISPPASPRLRPVRNAVTPQPVRRSASPTSARSASRGRIRVGAESPQRRSFDPDEVPLPPFQNDRTQSPSAKKCPAQSLFHMYDVDMYRATRVFPDAKNFRSCSALRPGSPGKRDDLDEHMGMSKSFKTDCVAMGCRKTAPWKNDNLGSISFTPPVPTTAETVADEPLIGLSSGRNTPFRPTERVPAKRHMTVPGTEPPSDGAAPALRGGNGSPSRGSTPTPSRPVSSRRAAGLLSPRYERASGMVPRSGDDWVCKGDRKRTVETPLSARSPTGANQLQKGLCRESTRVSLEAFLGGRRRRGPGSGTGASPPETPRDSSSGGANARGGALSWNAVALTPQIRRSAVTEHRVGMPGKTSPTDVESRYRQREVAAHRDVTSPRGRWKL